MSKVSIRQPVVLYAMVFMLIIAFVVVTLASVAMVNASRRAYRRAAELELRAIAGMAPAEELQRMLASRPADLELEVGVVTSGTAALGIDLLQAKRAMQTQRLSSPIVAVALHHPSQEMILIGRFSGSVPSSIAFVEITRMIPFVLIGALACAAVLAFMIGRLVLPPLNALAEIAQDIRAESEGALEPSDAPNEIVEVARQFRRTIGMLNQERRLIEAQRDELARMQASLVRASKLASVGRLAAGIAHEIGNPLAAVQGYLSLMKSGLDEQEETEVLERSLKELARIHETIKKLLAYARQGDEQEPTAPLSLGAVVAEALALVRGHPSIRTVEIDNRVAAGPPDAIGHADRLNQVLINLLLNAGQAMAEAETRKISLSLSVEESRVSIIISDSGPGIPEAKREQIFDPFFTTKAPGEGTGLGLAISRSLMEAMDGDLELLHSELGATFAVRLRRS
jgi:C4-dicarboxylate-specific signal transduction histidine kinase